VKFQYINPADLHSVWFQVRSGLEVVLEKSFETWIPEDVYCSIKTNNAQLFMFDGGFMVVQSIKDQWTNEPSLHIWITYHETNADVNLVNEFSSNLRQLANNAGINKITFGSKRRWEKHTINAKLKEFVYELEFKDE
jgi:hypothetical protein